AGHGGVEAIIVGLLGGINFVALAAMRSGLLLEQIPAEQLPLVEAQIEALFGTPPHLALLGAVERLFALAAHLAMSLMVMQVFTRGRSRWLLAAILWHTLLNAVAVFAVNTWSALVTEALIGVIALLSLGIIFWLRQPEPEEPELEPLPEAGPAEPQELPLTEETLDRSRYT
ncbi:MAG TPA: YhfC family glutamic-type intramembrane protease, partial [Anaerolineae bacterium]